MKKHVLAAVILALAASSGASEIPPGLDEAPAARIVLASQPGLDAVEAKELALRGPGPSAGLSREEKSWAIIGIALIAVILVVTV